MVKHYMFMKWKIMLRGNTPQMDLQFLKGQSATTVNIQIPHLALL